MNSLNIIGNIGADAELKVGKTSGKPFSTFSVAVKSGWGQNENTSWVLCMVFGDRAEKLAPYIKKGDRIGVTGELEVQEWTRDDGSRAQTVCCMVRNVTLLGQKKQAQQEQQADPEKKPSFDEDIPF